MPVELTDEQRRVVGEREGSPVEMVDPHTQRSYVLIAREQYDRIRSFVETPAAKETDPAIPEGIRRSQEAVRRALPELLAKLKYYHQWVAYHGEERIGIAPSETTLIRECLRRGLQDDEYYVGWIDPCELIEEEEIELRPQHIAEPEGFCATTDTP